MLEMLTVEHNRWQYTCRSQTRNVLSWRDDDIGLNTRDVRRGDDDMCLNTRDVRRGDDDDMGLNTKDVRWRDADMVLRKECKAEG